MSAFQQVAAQPSGSVLSIRGASTGTPSARGLASALRSAGISRDASAGAGMEIDGGAGRPARTIGGRGRGRAAGPLDQSSRPPRARNDATPYGRPPRAGSDRDTGPSRSSGSQPSGGLSARIGRGGGARSGHSRRSAEGTPPILRTQTATEEKNAQKVQAANLSAKLRNEGMKQWLRGRILNPGVMDMSKLPLDEYLKKEDIVAPGHRNASPMVGAVFWKLIDVDVQKPLGQPIHTLSLADNELHNFLPLDKLAHNLPHIRALDLSNNPVKHINELDILLARGEKKGNAMAGAGSLKSLIELKLNGCAFRENMLKEEKGDEKYQHEILRRFPGLLILDGVNLNRIVFPIERKPKVHLDDAERKRLQAVPFTFPLEVQSGFIDNEIVNGFVMQFCAMYFPLFDTNRSELLPAYAPNATVSASCNTLVSRSFLAGKVDSTRPSRPPTAPFSPWTDLPARNLFRMSSIAQRLGSLKSPVDTEDLVKWWAKVPSTKHPLTDPAKWNVDSWVLDGEGVNTKLCAMIQGEFQEMPSGSYRSFSRTFILGDASPGTTAQQAGWPAQILSDTLIVHQYLSTEAYDQNRSLAVHGVNIIPPRPAAVEHLLSNSTSQSAGSAWQPIGSGSAHGGQVPNQDAVVAQLRQATGMNADFATLCMAQNGWDFQVALRNFEEIKGTIPAEAFR